MWAVGEGVTKWKPGDEVIIHCNQASYEDIEVHGLDPMAAPSQRIWGYETTWGSFARMHSYALAKWEPMICFWRIHR